MGRWLAQIGVGCAWLAACGGGQAVGAATVAPTEPATAAIARVLAEGATVTGDTTGRPDRYLPGCGGTAPGIDGSGDERWVFTPTTSGHYRFTLEGEYDVVLAVREAEGVEIGCNDDDTSKRRSQLVLELVGGRKYEVIVDGYQRATGRYTLSVAPTEPPLPPGRHGRLVVGAPVEGNTTGARHTVTPSCGARDGSGDQVWHFVPAESGPHRVRVDAQYDSVVAVVADTGAELACNDDTDGNRASSVVVTTLEAGRAYGIVVDGYAGQQGAYRLVVEHVGAGSVGGSVGGGGGAGGATASTNSASRAGGFTARTCSHSTTPWWPSTTGTSSSLPATTTCARDPRAQFRCSSSPAARTTSSSMATVARRGAFVLTLDRAPKPGRARIRP
jgi:hypothetical protein